jgi:L-alanine-DL-glutamate epimerase-like enolase superfamily enzyme
MKIKELAIYQVDIPLLEPYHLSFSEIDSFHTILSVVRTEDNIIGIGESTALPGYSSESLEEMWKFGAEWGRIYPGSDIDDIIEKLQPFCSTSPFCVTALLTPLEMIKYKPNYSIPREGLSFKLLGAINSLEKENIRNEVDILLEKGFRTLKLKVGWELDKDISRTRYIQEVVADRAVIRIDANQGYSFEDAKNFVLGISRDNVELFEQPFSINEWEKMSNLRKISPIPLMLDESIHTVDDIDRTYESGCAQYVKFKLMKAGSLKRLEMLMTRALKNGLKVVVGNGVAGEIGCIHEALVSQNIIHNAGEMNGFSRQKESIFCKNIILKKGCMIVPGGFFDGLNFDRIERYLKAQKRWD